MKYKNLSRYLCSIIMLMLVSVSGWGEAVLFFELGDTFRIIERENLRVRENNRYKGFLYREHRGFGTFHLGDEESIRYKGNFFILEEMSRDASLLARQVVDSLKADFTFYSNGRIVENIPFSPPFRRNFPFFPTEGVKAGDMWTAPGLQLLKLFSGGPLVEVPFICRYEYKGEDVYQKRPVHVIEAQYALRYQAAQDWARISRERMGTQETGTIDSVAASYRSVIMLFADKEGGVFIRDTLEREIGFFDGNRESHSGFMLTWYHGLYGSTRKDTAITIAKVLDLDDKDIIDDDLPAADIPGADVSDEDLPDEKPAIRTGETEVDQIVIEEREEGITLGLRAILFEPNLAVMLPEEKPRLDRVAEVLKQFPNRSFLVVGHTADVGTREGQYTLSVERAEVFIDEMNKRGIPKEQFIFKGAGGSVPIAPNDTTEGRALNRRVEITILDG